jgi:5-(carboxyamino)imidazole ribonucleotide mutase
MKILVIFGSTSDESVYLPLVDSLKREYEVRLEILSAHKNPRELEELVKDSEEDVIFAGAGLAAHMPGIVASKTLKPIFGLPVNAHFGGLDATLCIQQMPFGVPVLAMGPDMASEGLDFLKSMMAYIEKYGKDKKDFHLILNQKIKDYEYIGHEIQRATEFAKETQLNLTMSGVFEEGKLNIRLVTNEDEVEKNSPCIHVPIFDRMTLNNPTKALRVFDWIRSGGVWVGVNNTRNALLGYLRFLS